MKHKVELVLCRFFVVLDDRRTMIVIFECSFCMYFFSCFFLKSKNKSPISTLKAENPLACHILLDVLFCFCFFIFFIVVLFRSFHFIHFYVVCLIVQFILNRFVTRSSTHMSCYPSSGIFVLLTLLHDLFLPWALSVSVSLSHPTLALPYPTPSDPIRPYLTPSDPICALADPI